MKEMRPKILDAALQVFMRYGVGRTRMSDIAAEAGIVRQTLYSFFDSKDAILCATIRRVSDLSLAEIKRRWERCDRLDEKLDVFFERAIIDSYRMITASPDARDMIDGYNARGKAEIERVQVDKIDAWAAVLDPHMPRPGKRNVSTNLLAEYIVLSSLGLRDNAGDERQLRALLDVQKLGIIALVNGT